MKFKWLPERGIPRLCPESIEFIVTNNPGTIGRSTPLQKPDFRQGIFFNNSAARRLPGFPLGHLASESTELPQPTLVTELPLMASYQRPKRTKPIEM